MHSSKGHDSFLLEPDFSRAIRARPTLPSYEEVLLGLMKIACTEVLAPLSRKHPDVGEFVWFGMRQAWSCLFGGLLLAGICATRGWSADLPLARYDFLFLYAVLIQVAMLWLKLESWREMGVIFLFHALALVMEVFKTSDSIASWSYPEENVLRLGNVPLFTGFMYSAVGSYIARAWRGFRFRFTDFPPLWIAGAIAVAAYLNFFTHHVWVDLRWAIVAAGVIAFRKTKVHFRPKEREYAMPLLAGFVLVAFFLWIAENLGTFARAWRYPDQRGEWRMVSFSKFTAWYLLMQLSFVLIYALRRVEARLKPSLRRGDDERGDEGLPHQPFRNAANEQCANGRMTV